jgi:hypothetical protein
MHFSHFGTSLKIPVAVEIVLMRLQRFTNSHFHFFVIVESAMSQVLLKRPKHMEVRRGKVIDAFVPSWHEFNTNFTGYGTLLTEQPLFVCLYIYIYIYIYGGPKTVAGLEAEEEEGDTCYSSVDEFDGRYDMNNVLISERSCYIRVITG